MDKNELREFLIDFIVMLIYPYGRHVGDSMVWGQAKRAYLDKGGEEIKWSVFHHSICDDMIREGILIKDGSLIGLTELGRKIGLNGGYTKYKQIQVQKEIEERKMAEEQRLLDKSHKNVMIICTVLTFFFSVLNFFIPRDSKIWYNILYLIIGILLGIVIFVPLKNIVLYLLRRSK